MKVEDFLLNGDDYEKFLQYLAYNLYGSSDNSLSNVDFVYYAMREKVGYLFETYRHNYLKQFVVDLEPKEPALIPYYQDNIMIVYFDKYHATLKGNSNYFYRRHKFIIEEYETLKTKLSTNHSKKYLVSENVTTNELSGSNENVATTSNTLNTEKINQGTPVNTDIYGVGNTLSAEKGKNTNNENTTTTQSNSENTTNTTVSNFNVNYILTLDNYDALIELDTRLKDILDDLINKYFYKPFKEIFINSIDFERIERIRGV